jgi:choline-sulfatase
MSCDVQADDRRSASRAVRITRNSTLRTHHSILIIAAALVAAAILVAHVWTGLFPAPIPPDILLVTLDTTRADHLGAYGDRRARTPRLDRLAREGVLFERAVAAAPITLPAHASLLTGTYPFTHGVRNNGNFSLRSAVPTLATVLHDRGYLTAAFVSSFVLDRRYGLAQGFEHYDDRLDRGPTQGELERRGDATARAATDWLTSVARDQSPLFLWVHLYDPHDPYDPPPPLREAFAGRLYDGEIAFADQAVGSMLDRLQQSQRRAPALVAAVGDHGESLGEHEEQTHSMFVYESVLRVPMILSWPRHLPAGRRVPGLVRGIDLAPTLLALAGQPPPAGMQGRSLMPLMEGRREPGVGAYSESYFPLFYMNWAPLRSIQDERWKFIDAPVPELYDLSNDAHEGTNLAAREPARTDALKRGLDQLTGGGAGAMSDRKVDSETVQKLAALGYVGAGSHVVGVPSSEVRPDPKEMIGLFNRLRDANAAVQAGRLAEADAIGREVLGRDPHNAFATIVLANAEMEQGRYREAIAHYRAYAVLVPTSADAHHRIAVCHARLGEHDRALAEEEAALAIDPRDADARELRGGLLAEAGRLDEALPELRAAVAIDPDNARFRVGLARAMITARRLDEAEHELNRAMELRPRFAAVHAAYGALAEARGQVDRAAAAFERALALDASQDDVRLDLARALERTGREADAQAEYRRLATARETPAEIRKAARARLRDIDERAGRAGLAGGAGRVIRRRGRQ